MSVTIELDGERATWDGKRWSGGGPMARLGNALAVDAPFHPSDPGGLSHARTVASAAGATIVSVTPLRDAGYPLVY